MKKIFIFFCFLNIFLSFSQEKSEIIILEAKKTQTQKKEGNILFSLANNLLYRHLTGVHSKRSVTLKEISNKIICTKDFQKNKSIKQNKNGVFIFYKKKLFKVFIYSKKTNAEDVGYLYEVETMVPFSKEID